MSTHPVSGYIMCLNEAETIRGAVLCLDRCVDEIVVLDGDSTDGTKEILEELKISVPKLKVSVHAQTAPRYGYEQEGEGWQQPWRRNYCLARCSHNWVFTLDADERISLPENFLRETNEPLQFPRYNIFDSTRYLSELPFEPWNGYPDYQLRFFDKSIAQYNDIPRHCVPHYTTDTGQPIIRTAKTTEYHIWHYHHLTQKDWDISEDKLSLLPLPATTPEVLL